MKENKEPSALNKKPSAVAELITLLRWDFVLQLRQKLWLAGAIVTAVYILILAAIPQQYADVWIPVLLFGEICTIGLLFVAGILFLERRQGSIYAFAISPTPTSRWLLSKTISLTMICVVLGCLIVLSKGRDIDWLRVMVAITLSATFYTLLGFLIAAAVRGGVAQYFLPMILITSVTSIPAFWHLGIIDHPLLWLIPSHPAMVMLSGCFNDIETSHFYLAALVLMLWIALSYRLGIAAFHRFISARKGI